MHAVGPKGPQGDQGPQGATGAEGPSGTSPTLAFTNQGGSVSLLPANNEVVVASVTTSTTAGQNIKVDYALQVDTDTAANSSIAIEFRLYRGGPLLLTRMFRRSLAAAGSQVFDIADTYVDTAPSTNPSTVYQVRAILTTAQNVTTASASNRNLNLVKFI